jgi:hypothetical protein
VTDASTTVCHLVLLITVTGVKHIDGMNGRWGRESWSITAVSAELIIGTFLGPWVESEDIGSENCNCLNPCKWVESRLTWNTNVSVPWAICTEQDPYGDPNNRLISYPPFYGTVCLSLPHSQYSASQHRPEQVTFSSTPLKVTLTYVVILSSHLRLSH